MKSDKEELTMTWVLSKLEDTTGRYIEAEKMIVEIIDMPWYKRLFCKRKLLLFLRSTNKYDF